MIRNVVICVETEKAFLLKFCSSKKTEWFPKNRITILEKMTNSMTYRETYKVEIK